MTSPKGHKPYNGSQKGAPYGILGKPDSSWTEEEAIHLGTQLIEWFFKSRMNIWKNNFFTEIAYVDLTMVDDLEKRYPAFKKFMNRARQLQEARLASMPLDKSKNGIDGYHARWMLARHHKGEWEDKPQIIEPDQIAKLDKAAQLVDYLQSESARKIAESNINNADKSKLDTDD